MRISVSIPGMVQEGFDSIGIRRECADDCDLEVVPMSGSRASSFIMIVERPRWIESIVPEVDLGLDILSQGRQVRQYWSNYWLAP